MKREAAGLDARGQIFGGVAGIFGILLMLRVAVAAVLGLWKKV